MLQYTTGLDGSIILVAYLSFPNECEFEVMKMHDGGVGAARFTQMCHIFGPQVLDKGSKILFIIYIMIKYISYQFLLFE